MTATGPARLRRGADRRHESSEGSGEPQGGAPVDREGSGEPQGGAPVNASAGRADRDLAEERAPDEVLAGFLGRRGRTDFARARRRSRLGGLASAGVFAGLVLIFYGAAFGLGPGGEILGTV